MKRLNFLPALVLLFLADSCPAQAPVPPVPPQLQFLEGHKSKRHSLGIHEF